MRHTPSEEQVAGSQHQPTSATLADKASRIVVQRPGTCLAVGFVLGGALAWLMSRRS